MCNDKLFTTLALLHAGIPTPRTLLAFDSKASMRGIEMLGYPFVLKPTTGSWSRLLARIQDRDAAEAVLEHQETPGSYQHHIRYIQEYIATLQRDIRAFVVGEHPSVSSIAPATTGSPTPHVERLPATARSLLILIACVCVPRERLAASWPSMYWKTRSATCWSTRSMPRM